MAELKINRKFAERYDRYREKEELQRLKDRYGDKQADDSGSSGSDSEDDLAIDPQLDKDFYRTLSLLKKKDPIIYKEGVTFYTEADPSVSNQSKSSKEKPMYLKDYERKVILEKEGKYEDDETSDEDEQFMQDQRARSPTYMEEQRQIRESFRQFVEDSDNDEEDENAASLLTKRTKTRKEQEQEDEEYIAWLRGQKNVENLDDVKEMNYLKEYWNNPKLDEGEKFLRDYILNKEYKDEESEEEEKEEEDDDEECPPALEEALHISDSEDEGELFLKKQEDFERKYNFRFEEPDSELITTFPRTIAHSVRRKDDRRKRKREEIKERKKKEKEKIQEELKQLKNLKRKELQGKLQKLRELSGDQHFGVTEEDLLDDFDPAKHDEIMQKCFGDDYYGVEEPQKPQFEDDEELEEDWNWDKWTGAEEQEAGDSMAAGGWEDASAPHCDDPNFVMDAEYDPQAAPGPSRKERKKMRLEQEKNTKKRKRSQFAEAVSREKPLFNPDDRSFQQYVEEYYKLDYEDIVDDLPCRFKYRPVVACDFGLTTEEILGADDSDLNRWCSLRKTCMYRSDKEDISDQSIYRLKGQNTWKKQQILKSLTQSNDDESETLSTSKSKLGKKRRERLKTQAEDNEQAPESPKAERSYLMATAPPKEEATREEKPAATTPRSEKGKDSSTTESGASGSAKRRKKRKGGCLLSSRLRLGGREFSGQRLQAYGLNPKKLKYKQLDLERRKQRKKKSGGGTAGEPQKKRRKSGGGTAGEPQKKRKSGRGTAGEPQKRKSGDSTAGEPQLKRKSDGSTIGELQKKRKSGSSTVGELQQKRKSGGGTAGELQQKRKSGGGTAGELQGPQKGLY